MITTHCGKRDKYLIRHVSAVHEDPERLKAFFAETAAFTNDFDVQRQNEAALETFIGLQEARGR